MAAVTICSDFGVQEKSVSFHCFPIYLPWSDGTGCHDFSFMNWVLSQLFYSPLPLSSGDSFSSLLSAISVMSFAYLKYFIFLLAILITAYALSSPAFCIMYSAYKLNKQGDTIQPLGTPFPIWVRCSLSGFKCCFLTCIQISQDAGKVVWYSHLFQNFPQFVVIHTDKL